MNIKILSRKNAVRLSYKELEIPKVIISVSDPYKENAKFNRENKSIKDVLYLSFYDIDYETKDIYRGFEPMQTDDAQKIRDFVLKWQNNVGEIWVNCEEGISRSAGIAAALKEHFGEDSKPIFECDSYSPNELCYNLVKSVFATSKTDENVV